MSQKNLNELILLSDWRKKIDYNNYMLSRPDFHIYKELQWISIFLC